MTTIPPITAGHSLPSRRTLSPSRPAIKSKISSPLPSPKVVKSLLMKPILSSVEEKSSLMLQCGVIYACIAQPALAVTGENNNPEDLTSILIQSGIVAFGYFLVMPPVIMNWMRLRFYKRKFFEMYLQFMFVFIFFPGILLWAPFLNFRRFPRDPTMKYPWSTPQEASLD